MFGGISVQEHADWNHSEVPLSVYHMAGLGTLDRATAGKATVWWELYVYTVGGG